VVGVGAAAEVVVVVVGATTGLGLGAQYIVGTVHAVGAGCAVDDVGSGAAAEEGVAAEAVDPVVAAAAVDAVGSWRSDQYGVLLGADDVEGAFAETGRRRAGLGERAGGSTPAVTVAASSARRARRRGPAGMVRFMGVPGEVGFGQAEVLGARLEHEVER
jgi:hypothetical protein